MIKSNICKNDQTASLGVVEPEARLLAGILAQTFFDLRARDPLTSVDALLFFMDPQAGEMFLEAIVQPNELVRTYAKKFVQPFPITGTFMDLCIISSTLSYAVSKVGVLIKSKRVVPAGTGVSWLRPR